LKKKDIKSIGSVPSTWIDVLKCYIFLTVDRLHVVCRDSGSRTVWRNTR